MGVTWVFFGQPYLSALPVAWFGLNSHSACWLSLSICRREKCVPYSLLPEHGTWCVVLRSSAIICQLFEPHRGSWWDPGGMTSVLCGLICYLNGNLQNLFSWNFSTLTSMFHKSSSCFILFQGEKKKPQQPFLGAMRLKTGEVCGFLFNRWHFKIRCRS